MEVAVAWGERECGRGRAARSGRSEKLSVEEVVGMRRSASEREALPKDRRGEEVAFGRPGMGTMSLCSRTRREGEQLRGVT